MDQLRQKVLEGGPGGIEAPRVPKLVAERARAKKGTGPATFGGRPGWS